MGLAYTFLMFLQPHSARWNPWDEATRERAQVRLRPMKGGLLGACDWRRRVLYINAYSTLAQQSCALTHELLHLRRGPLMCANERVRIREEAAINRETARLMIPLDSLLDALRWAESTGEQAEMLGVDRLTVRTRLCNLTREEQTIVHELLRAERTA